MAAIIITPLGNTVAITDFVPVLKGAAIYFGSFREVFPNVLTAQIYYKQIVQQLISQTASTNIVLDFSGPVITGISPVPFDFGNGGAGVSITGFNFNLNNASFFHVEDDVGSTDSNGYVMACTIVDSQHISAVWLSDQAGGTAANMLLYLNGGQSTAGSLSNIVPAKWTAGTIITNVFI